MRTGLIKRRSGYFIFLCLLLWGTAVYSNSFFGSFHFDDEQCIVNNPSLRHATDVVSLWRYWPTRFVTFFSLALNYHIGGLHVFGYHVFNFLTHVATSWLIYVFVLLTFKSPEVKKDRIAAHGKGIAFFVSVLFLVHPVQTQSVDYIIQRATLLAAFFYMASLCFYVLARQERVEGFSCNRWKILYVGSFGCALLSMFSKELAVTLPLSLCLYEYFFLKRERSSRLKWMLPFLFILFVVPLTMFFVKMFSVPVDHFKETRRIVWGFSEVAPLDYFLTQLRAFWTYGRLLFIPVNQNLDYDYSFSKSIMSPEVFISFLGIISFLYVAFRGVNRYRLVSFSIFLFFIMFAPWFFIGLFPESSVMAMINDVIFEHRLYLGVLAFGFFIVCGLFYFFNDLKVFKRADSARRFRPVIVILFSLSIVFSFATYQRNKIWKDEVTLWSDVIAKSPDKARGYNNRGYAYLKQGRLDLSLQDFTMAIKIQPDLAKAYNNRAQVYFDKGDFNAAFLDFNKAIEIQPDYAKAISNRAAIYLKEGRFDEALADYNEAIRIEPGLSGIYNNRGDAYMKAGNTDLALSDYSIAIELEPEFALAYSNRGFVYLKKGDYDRALSDYSKAIAIEPDSAQAYNNRANIYFNKGDVARALVDYDRATKIDPSFGDVYYNRAVLYVRLNDTGGVERQIVELNRLNRYDLAQRLKDIIDGK
jgi:tetratricopeptide (TPR) repeat protein